MSTVAEIEAAIQKLPSGQLGELFAWVDEFKGLLEASDALFAVYDKEEADAEGKAG